jgi:hypothetical protein
MAPRVLIPHPGLHLRTMLRIAVARPTRPTRGGIAVRHYSNRDRPKKPTAISPYAIALPPRNVGANMGFTASFWPSRFEID